MPTVLGAILICGVRGARLSSASTFLSLVGFSVSHILGGGGGRPQRASNNAETTREGSAYIMLMVGLSVIGLRYYCANIYWLTHFAGPLFASS